MLLSDEWLACFSGILSSVSIGRMELVGEIICSDKAWFLIQDSTSPLISPCSFKSSVATSG